VDSGHRRQAFLSGQWTQVTGSSERTVDSGHRRQALLRGQ
jgi:hypothetical protein